MEISIEVLIADSRLAFVQGRYNESLKLADEALKVDENNSDAHQCAGNAYMSKQDYDNAIEHYKIAVENDADNGDRYFNLGYAYATSNQPVKALEMFAKADEIGCSPNVVGQLYKIMGMLCFDLHRYNDAIINLIKSEKVVGIDMDVLQRKALSYSMSGQTSNGIEVANQMKLLAPTEYLGYRIAFNILLQEERLEEAEKELDRAERFAKPVKELFFDWVAYENARYELDGDKEHLYLAKANRQKYIENNFPDLSTQAKIDLYGSCMFAYQSVLKFMSGAGKKKAISIIKKYKKNCNLSFDEINTIKDSSKKYFMLAKFNFCLCCKIKSVFKIGF